MAQATVRTTATTTAMPTLANGKVVARKKPPSVYTVQKCKRMLLTMPESEALDKLNYWSIAWPTLVQSLQEQVVEGPLVNLLASV